MTQDKNQALTTAGGPLVPSIAAVDEVKHSIAVMQDLVAESLERGIDFGRTPGTPRDSLWDPGAALIISSFGCYPGERRIISLVDDGKKIAVILEVPIINRATGRTVGTGIGAASTLESKYKYRWVDDIYSWGYTEDTVKGLRTRKKKNTTDSRAIEYRIPNPEHDELLNTLIKIASKRAEVDGAESLPGVKSVLRKMFDPERRDPRTGRPAAGGSATKQSPGTRSDRPDWTRFWGEVNRMGITQDDARKILKVTDVYQYLAQGKTIDDAIAELRAYVGVQGNNNNKGG